MLQLNYWRNKGSFPKTSNPLRSSVSCSLKSRRTELFSIYVHIFVSLSLLLVLFMKEERKMIVFSELRLEHHTSHRKKSFSPVWMSFLFENRKTSLNAHSSSFRIPFLHSTRFDQYSGTCLKSQRFEPLSTVLEPSISSVALLEVRYYYSPLQFAIYYAFSFHRCMCHLSIVSPWSPKDKNASQQNRIKFLDQTICEDGARRLYPGRYSFSLSPTREWSWTFRWIL